MNHQRYVRLRKENCEIITKLVTLSISISTFESLVFRDSNVVVDVGILGLDFHFGLSFLKGTVFVDLCLHDLSLPASPGIKQLDPMCHPLSKHLHARRPMLQLSFQVSFIHFWSFWSPFPRSFFGHLKSNFLPWHLPCT